MAIYTCHYLIIRKDEKVDMHDPITPNTSHLNTITKAINMNTQNELVKRKYKTLLIETQNITQRTVDARLKSLYRLDDFLNGQDYRCFNATVAKKFKQYVMNRRFRNKKVSAKTIYQTLKDVKAFFIWLSDKPGYKSKIRIDDIQYLNPPADISNEAKNMTPRLFPTSLGYAKELILSIKGDSDIDRRDRAIIAILITTGIRTEALTTLPISAIDIHQMTIDQNPANGIKTKFRKRIYTKILPMDSLFTDTFKEWFLYLTNQHVPHAHPLFPKTTITHAQGTFSFINTTISDKFMRQPAQINRILKKRIQEAHLPYYSAHAFRHLHEYIVEKVAKTPRDIKLISQNLGHKHMATTLFQYGHITEQQQIDELDQFDFSKVG